MAGDVARRASARLKASDRQRYCDAQISSGSCSTIPVVAERLFEFHVALRIDSTFMIEQYGSRNWSVP